MDLKTLLSGQEGPGIDADAISIRHQRRLTAEGQRHSREEELDLVLRPSCPTHASLRR